MGKQLADELDATFVHADFTSPDGAAQLADAVLKAESRLDVLVNNAGMEVVMPIESLNTSVLDAIWQVNVRSPFILTHRLLPLLRATPGASIINMTSIHDTTPYPNNAAYSASKAALAMFTKTIAVELAPDGIRANNLAPGAVETDINRKVIQEIGEDKFREWIPLGIAQTEDIVGPALFLASDAARYITGTTLYADGGYLQNLVRYRPQPEETTDHDG
jgi:NAD(P)-dependent dehydrogenase (short-subunit alcohol dehydrogenase family)